MSLLISRCMTCRAEVFASGVPMLASGAPSRVKISMMAACIEKFEDDIVARSTDS